MITAEQYQEAKINVNQYENQQLKNQLLFLEQSKKVQQLKKRYFFINNDDEENCYNLNWILNYMADNHISILKVFLAKRETDSGYFFCKKYQQSGTKEESNCGKSCPMYDPRNGKSGICKHSGYVYEFTNQEFELKCNPTYFLD